MTQTQAATQSARQDPINVALANDYEVVVLGLERMLSAFPHRVRVTELDVKVPVEQPVDITLYDTFARSQVDRSDIDAVLADPNSGKVVVFSWNLHPGLIEAAVRKGVRGYLSKGLSAADLVEALERIHAGEVVLSPAEVVDDPVNFESGAWPGQNEGLSAREAEVVSLITQGLSNQDIAKRTYLSINSVKSYVRNAYRKMGVESRSQAVLWGVQHGMAPDRGRVVRRASTIGQ